MNSNVMHNCNFETVILLETVILAPYACKYKMAHVDQAMCMYVLETNVHEQRKL